MFARDEASASAKLKSWWAGVVGAAVAAAPAADREKIEEALRAQAPKGLVADKDDKDDDKDDKSNETHIHIHPGDSTRDQEEEEKKKKDAEDARFKMMLDSAITPLAASVDRITKHLGLDEGGNKEIEGKLEEEAPPGTGDKARMAKDSTYVRDAHMSTLSAAEILVPGIQVPAFDLAAPPIRTYDNLCKVRRTALDLAYSTTDGRGIIDEITGGRPLETAKMDCSAVRTLFLAAAAAKKRSNNGAARSSAADVSAATRVGNGGGVRGPVQTISDLNKRNAARYKQS